MGERFVVVLVGDEYGFESGLLEGGYDTFGTIDDIIVSRFRRGQDQGKAFMRRVGLGKGIFKDDQIGQGIQIRGGIPFIAVDAPALRPGGLAQNKNIDLASVRLSGIGDADLGFSGWRI